MDNIEFKSYFDPLFLGLEDLNKLINNRPLLAHYTTLENLEKIIKSGEIWFSNPLLMNDYGEVVTGLNMAKNIISKQEKEIRGACLTSDRYKKTINYLESHWQAFEKEQAFDTYVFCLTEHDYFNSDGILSMWRGYGGKGGGAAIVFNTDFVYQKDEGILIIAQVKYRSNEEREEFLREKLSSWCKVLEEKNIPDEFLSWSALALFHIMKLASLTTKYDGFKEEREWRAIYFRDRDKNGKHLKSLGYVIGVNGVEPKLKINLKHVDKDDGIERNWDDMINKIILGPHISSPISIKSVQRMLECMGEKDIVNKISVSKIPLRK